MSDDKDERDDMRRVMLRVQAFERELLDIDDPNERIAARSLWRDAQVAIIERDGRRWLKLAKAKAFRAAVAYHENARAEALDALANLETGAE